MANTKPTVEATETKPMVPQRKQRIPVSGPRDILTISNKDPNYVYRWVKDLPGRIQRFLDAGYEIVVHEAQMGQKTVDSGSRLGSALTRQDGGSQLVAMRIPKEWFEEDQLAKQAEIDALEESIRADGGANRSLGSLERPDSGSFKLETNKKR